MNPTTALIWAAFSVPGTHYWPDAHEGREYLASEHRHLFHVRVEVRVTEDDRQFEFHDLAELAETVVRETIANGEEGGMLTFGPRSCETLARELLTELAAMEVPVTGVSWSEDGEFGAVIRTEAS